MGDVLADPQAHLPGFRGGGVHTGYSGAVLHRIADHCADLQRGRTRVAHSGCNLGSQLHDLGRRGGASGLFGVFHQGCGGLPQRRKSIPRQLAVDVHARTHLDEACRGQRQFLMGGQNLERGYFGTPVVEIAVLARHRGNVDVRVEHHLAIAGHREHPCFVVGGGHVAPVVEAGHMFDAKAVHSDSPTQLGAALVGK